MSARGAAGTRSVQHQEVPFALDGVRRLYAEGEFDIIVVGTAGEKRYTVKPKHFKRLPL